MAINLESLRKNVVKPARIIIHSDPGLGKTTFGACAPAPVFIQTVYGLGNLDATAFPLARSFGDVMEAVATLYTEKHDFKTLVVDSLDWLEPLSTNPWFYVIIFTIALLDSVVPAVPSVTTVILGGIAAGQGHLWLGAVIILGALGAAAGDNIAYWLGRRSGGWLKRRIFNGDKRAARLDWAEDQLAKRGGMLLVTARFIPGGRTAITVSSGITHQDYRRFLAFDGMACALWATYAGTLGYIFGDRFKDNHTRAFIFAFAAALSVTVLIEAGRWLRHRSRPEAA